jgi:hypothetical protein
MKLCRELRMKVKTSATRIMIQTKCQGLMIRSFFKIRVIKMISPFAYASARSSQLEKCLAESICTLNNYNMPGSLDYRDSGREKAVVLKKELVPKGETGDVPHRPAFTRGTQFNGLRVEESYELRRVGDDLGMLNHMV